MKKTKLRQDYEDVCSRYIKAFVRKQEIRFDYWIGGDIGGVASFIEQYCFNLSDIVFDIDNKCEPGLILSWQDYCIDEHNVSINFYSYSKGLRIEKPTRKEKFKKWFKNIKNKIFEY